MATQPEIMKCLAMLKAAHPEWGKTYSQPEQEAYFRVCLNIWGAIPRNVLETSVTQWIGESKFFPKPSEIRDLAIELTAPQYPDSLAAWNDCMKRGRKAEPLAWGVFQQLGFDRSDIRHMEFRAVSVIQSNFLKAYDTRVKQKKEERKMLPQTKKLQIGEGK